MAAHRCVLEAISGMAATAVTGAVADASSRSAHRGAPATPVPVGVGG